MESEIKKLEELDNIEWATGETPWISPIVATTKPNNLEELRISVDMQQANKAVKREWHVIPSRRHHGRPK